MHAVYHLPSTPNARAVADAWHAAGDGESKPERIGLLIVSGDEIARDARLRELAGKADAVVAIGMFAEELRPFADVVLPATSYLERDGTMVNLEGRVQRLRRVVMPPCPDELAWVARLAERFGVTIAPEARGLFAELSPKLYPDVAGERGGFGPEVGAPEPPKAKAEPKDRSGRRRRATPADELPHAVLGPAHRARARAPLPATGPRRRGRRRGRVRLQGRRERRRRPRELNGTSVELRARVNRRLVAGVVRAAEEHIQGLEAGVEVTRL